MKLSVRIVEKTDGTQYPEFFDSSSGEILEGVIGCELSYSVHDASQANVRIYLHDPLGKVFTAKA